MTDVRGRRLVAWAAVAATVAALGAYWWPRGIGVETGWNPHGNAEFLGHSGVVGLEHPQLGLVPDPRQAVIERDVAAVTESRSNVGRLVVAVIEGTDQQPIPATGGRLVCLGESDPWKSTRRFITDSAGEAAFAELLVGQVLVFTDLGATAEGWVVGGETVRLEVPVPACVDVDGIVVDSTGAPVPGAAIWLSGHGSPTLTRLIAESDGSGQFRFRHTAESRSIAAMHPAYLRSAQQQVSAAPSARQRIVLELPDGTPGSLVCRITCARGDVPNCQVSLRPLPIAGQSAGGIFANVATYPIRADDVTEAIEFVALPPGGYELLVEARGHESQSREIQIREHQNFEEIRLSEGGRAEGIVRSAEGHPVAGCEIRVHPVERPGRYECVTNARGEFSIAGLPVGAAVLVASHVHAGRAELDISVRESSPNVLAIALTQGLGIKGRIHSSIPGTAAQIRVGAWRSDSKREILQVASPVNADGSFVLQDLEATIYVVALLAPGPSGQFLRIGTITGVPAGGEFLDVDLDRFPSPSAWVRGRVVDQFGQTVTGAVIAVGSASKKQLYKLDVTSGSFEVGPLLPGDYEMDVACQGYGKVLLDPLTLSPNAGLDLGVVTLSPPGSLVVAIAEPQSFGAKSCELYDARGRSVGSQPVAVVMDFGPLPSAVYTLRWGVASQSHSQAVIVRSGGITRIAIDPDRGN